MCPKEFLECAAKKNSNIRTKKLSGRRYQHICYDDKGEHEGHIKTKKKSSK